MEANKQEKAFLLELEKLTRETGIVVGGCGCCGSPTLSEQVNEVTDPRAGYAAPCGLSYFGWVDPGDEYDWENYRQDIVKEESPCKNANIGDTV